MYTIIRSPDGKFHCEGKLQDGTERWVEDSLDAAVESMKKFAKVMNGTKIKRKSITFLQPEFMANPRIVEWNPWS